nr:hypothetical protein [Tanacetum cinerariifolium]GEX31248.1 hypothetical protein [Tanacetum cinerariifolium]
MLAKQNYPISKEKINTTPINYVELNRLSEDFGKRFVPQKELSAKQAFWLQTSHPNTDQSATSPFKVEVPRELPKKELKLENKRLLEHIICQDVMNIVMHADVKSNNMLHVQNTFVDDNIALDVMKMENDHLMELLVSHDLVHTAVNSLAAINDYKYLNPGSSKLKNNREAHVDYIRITKENADTLRDIVEQARTSNPLDNALSYACILSLSLHCQVASVHISLGLALQWHMTSADKTSGLAPQRKESSRLVQNPVSPSPYVPPSKKDYEILFQPLFDEYFNPPPRDVSPDPVAIAALRAFDPTVLPASTTIDQDVLSASTSPINQVDKESPIREGYWRSFSTGFDKKSTPRTCHLVLL